MNENLNPFPAEMGKPLFNWRGALSKLFGWIAVPFMLLIAFVVGLVVAVIIGLAYAALSVTEGKDDPK